MTLKALKDVLGAYGDLAPEGERKFANLHGPIAVKDTPEYKVDYSDDAKKTTKDKYAPVTKQLSKDITTKTEEVKIDEEDHGSHHVKVRRGTNGKYAPFKVFDDGHVEKCGNWYTDKSEAQLAAGLKEGFADFVNDEVIEGFDDEPVASEVELDEDHTEDYDSHHEAAMRHLMDAARALKAHKRFIQKGGNLHGYHAEHMKHTARQIEDLKDHLQGAARGAEHSYKQSQREPVS